MNILRINIHVYELTTTFTSSVVWSVFLRGCNDKEGILTMLYIVSFFLWVIRVAGCLLGLTDSKLHVIYMYGTSGKTAH